jgi:hypothetical protein
MAGRKRWAGLAAGLTSAWLIVQGGICLAADDPAPPPVRKNEPAHAERSGAGPEKQPSVGVKEIPRADGGKDRIYFSVTPESDRRDREQAEKNKIDKSMELLPQNVLILRH